MESEFISALVTDIRSNEIADKNDISAALLGKWPEHDCPPFRWIGKACRGPHIKPFNFVEWPLLIFINRIKLNCDSLRK